MKIVFTFFICLIPVFLLSTVIQIPNHYTTIQEGIDVSVEGDTVLVLPGIYYENIDYNGKNITVASAYLITQDSTWIPLTIIDGSQPSDPDHTSVVYFRNEEDSTASLIGFTITNGSGTSIAGPHGYFYVGGGIYVNNSSPRIANVNIVDNSAYVGGGIYLEQSSPILHNLLIENNNGEGIYCFHNTSIIIGYSTIRSNSDSGIYCSSLSSLYLDHVKISNNSNSGIKFLGSFLNMKNVTLCQNTTNTEGGGIYCDTCLDSSPIIENCIIALNQAADGGGGALFHHCSPIIVNTKIIQNFATGWGGGISANEYSDITLKNVLIAGNSATDGAGIYCDASNPTLINVTFSENSTYPEGNVIFCRDGSNTMLKNCILWNNLSNEIAFCPDNSENTIEISYSDIQGGEEWIETNDNGTVYWLDGNLAENPLFLESEDNPFSLQDLSPCVNIGIPDTTGLNLPELDLAGDPRVYGGRIDMGAYENQNVVVNVNENIIPSVTILHQNYPNPFNPAAAGVGRSSSTVIGYQLSEINEVSLKIYNIKGQIIKTLVNDTKSADKHSVIWDGRDDKNRPVPSGIYLYILSTKDDLKIRKMVLLR